MQIEVRRWDIEDIHAYHMVSIYSNHVIKRVWKYFYPDRFLPSISRLRFYEQADTQRFMYRAITFQNEVCGHMECIKQDATSCELIFWLHRSYWNQGIMKQAVQHMCKEVFGAFDSMYIYANVHKKNKAACTVLEKNGFQKDQDRKTMYRYKRCR